MKITYQSLEHEITMIIW